MKVKSWAINTRPTGKSRGAFVTLDTKRGPVIQKWPRARGKARSGYQWIKQQEFGLAARWAVTPEPLSFITAKFQTTGSDYVPRDALVASMYGNFLNVYLEGVGLLENARVTAPDPQQVFDLFSTDKGVLIYRGENFWFPLEIGADGKFLGVLDGLPNWLDPPASGGGGSPLYPQSFQWWTNASFNLTMSAVQGTTIALKAGQQVSGAAFYAYAAQAAANFSAVLYQPTGDTTATLLASSSQTNGVAAGWNTATFSAPFTIASDGLYLVGMQLLGTAFRQYRTAQNNPRWVATAGGSIPTNLTGIGTATTDNVLSAHAMAPS